MRANFISQNKDDKEKNFWTTLITKLGLKKSMTKMASKIDIDRPREIVKEGLIISYKPSGEYTIKLGHKSDIVVTGVVRQEKELQSQVKNALSYLRFINPRVASELNKIEAEKRDILIYKDVDRCRDCVFYESDASHETYRDKCKNCVNAMLGGEINNFFPRSQQLVVFTPNWEQVGDTKPKVAFQGTMSLLDAHRQGRPNERVAQVIASEVVASAKSIDAVGLGTSLMKYFKEQKLNFQRYAKSVIQTIEKSAGIQMHIKEDKNVILAVEQDVAEWKDETGTQMPQKGTQEFENMRGEAINKKMQANQALTKEEQDYLDNWLLVYKKSSAEVPVGIKTLLVQYAKKKGKEMPGTPSKCDQDAMKKYEEVKDNYPKSKEIMPKGNKFEGTLCSAEKKVDDEEIGEPPEEELPFSVFWRTPEQYAGQKYFNTYEEAEIFAQELVEGKERQLGIYIYEGLECLTSNLIVAD